MKKLIKFSTFGFTTVSAIALTAAQAYAAPVVGIITAAATAIGGNAIAGAIFTAALSYGVNMLIAKLFAPDEPVNGVKDRLESGGDLPLSYIVGQFATPGKLVYVNEWTNNDDIDNNKLVFVISISQIPINGISNEVWVNGEHCNVDWGTTLAYYGFSPVDDYIMDWDSDSYCKMQFFDGTQTTANTYLMDKFSTDPDKPWSSNMIGEGCAYVVVECSFSRKGVWAGIPDFLFVAEGISLYDISKDSSEGGSGSQRWNNKSTWEPSGNPKVIAYNIIRGITYDGDWIHGGQDVSSYQLPPDYWIPAIQTCNENVTSAGGTIKRYLAGGEFSVDQNTLDIIKELDKCCSGFTTEYGGTWKTWVGPPGTAIYSFTDEDIILEADQVDDPFRELQTTYNGARGTYTQPSGGWVSKDTAPRLFPDLVDEDHGYELIADVQLPLVISKNQIQRLMKAAVKESRRDRSHTLVLPPSAYILDVYDAVTWTSVRNGYENKKFFVTSIDDYEDGTQLLNIRETDPSDYDFEPEEEEDEYMGPLDPIRPTVLALDFTVSADQVDGDGGKKDRPAILLEWDWGIPDADAKFIRYELRKTGTTKIIARKTIRNLSDNEHLITHSALKFNKDYQVRIWVEPYRRIRNGSWSIWRGVTTYLTDVPTAPSLTRVSELADDGTLNFYLDVDWVEVAQESSYHIRVTQGSTVWNYNSDTNYIRIPVTSGNTYYVKVRTKGLDGEHGDFSPTSDLLVTKKLTAPIAPTSLSTNPGVQHNQIVMSKSTEKDYKESVIYRATVNNFASAVEVGRKTGTRHSDSGLGDGISYYYWITYVDKTGNESSKFPVSNTGGILGKTLLVGDATLDPTVPTVPSAPSITQLARDIDEDGKVDIALKVSWSASTNSKTYEVEITQGSDVWYMHTKNRSVIFKAKSNKLYSIKVGGISTSSVASAFSTASTFTPSKKSALPATPGSVTVTTRPKKMVVGWATATENDFKWARVYRNTVNNSGTATSIGRTKADYYKDDNDLVAGTLYYYWVSFIDTTGNEGAKSAVAYGIFQAISTNDLNVNDLSSNVENNDLSLGPDIGWDTPALISYDPTNAYNGDYVIKRAYTGSASTTVIRNNGRFAVREGEQWFIGCVVKKSGDYAGANFGVRTSWRNINGTEIGTSTAGLVPSATTSWTQKSYKVTVPAGAAFGVVEVVFYSQTAGTAYVSHAYARNVVSAEVTDDTPPSTPSAPSLSQVSVDVDEDGKVDIAIKATISPVADAKTYALQITQGSDVSTVDIGSELIHIFKAKSNKLYSVKAIAVSFNGTPSSKSSASTFTPVKKSALPSTPTGVVVAARANKMVIKFTYPSDKDFKTANIYRNTTNTFPGGSPINSTKAARYEDSDTLVAGTRYYYWVKFVDTSDNEGAQSSSDNDVYRPLKAAEMEVMDTSNMMRNSNADDVSQWIGTGLLSLPTSYIGASSNRLEVSASTALTTIATAEADIPVEGGVDYFISGVLGPDGGSTPSTNYLIYAQWYSMDATGALTYISTSNVSGNLTTLGKISGIVTSPSNARRLRYIFVKNVSGTSIKLTGLGPIVRRATSTDLISAGSVTDSKTDQTTAATPAGGTLAVAQVPTDLNGDGVVDMAFKMVASSLPTRAKSVLFRVDYNYPATPDYQYFAAENGLIARCPVIAGKDYSISYCGISFNGTPGAYSTAVLKTADASADTIEPYAFSVVELPGAVQFTGTFDVGGSPVVTPPSNYAYSEIYRASDNLFTTNYELVYRGVFSGDLTIPYHQNHDRFFRIRHFTRSGEPSLWLNQTGLLATKTYSVAGNIGETVTTLTDSHALTAGTWTTVYTKPTSERALEGMKLHMQFRNTNASAQDIEVRFFKSPFALQSPAIKVPAGMLCSFAGRLEFSVAPTSGWVMQLKCANAINVDQINIFSGA